METRCGTTHAPNYGMEHVCNAGKYVYKLLHDFSMEIILDAYMLVSAIYHEIKK